MTAPETSYPSQIRMPMMAASTWGHSTSTHNLKDGLRSGSTRGTFSRAPQAFHPLVAEEEGHSDWKKLRGGPPDYLPLLEEIFEGVAVDGSTSFVPGHTNLDGQASTGGHGDEEEECREVDNSPMSSSSRKRTSTTTSTGSSPVKKTKSPMVKVMKDYLSVSSEQQAERNHYLKRVCSEKEGRKSLLSASIKQAQELALEAGVDESSSEFYVVCHICRDDSLREFFINMKTAAGRLSFLKRFCREKNLE